MAKREKPGKSDNEHDGMIAYLNWLDDMGDEFRAQAGAL